MVKRSKNKPSDERAYFFKIMFPGFSTTRLRIPTDFVEHISAAAYTFATIEDSNGCHWRIKLSKTTGGTYLEDGWENFVNHHSIYDYNFLVFGYDGSSCFHVNIFDETGCERDYLFRAKPSQEPAFSNGAKKCGNPSKTSTYSVQEASISDPGRSLPTFKRKAFNKARKENVKLTHEPLSKSKYSSLRRRAAATEEEKAKVWEEAKSFTSKFPCFMRCLTVSNVYHGFVLYIPMKFARTHVHLQQDGKVTLYNKKGQAWRANISNTRGRTFLGGGMREFARANKLEEADICIFELVGKFKMHVHIFRAVKKVKFATEKYL